MSTLVFVLRVFLGAATIIGTERSLVASFVGIFGLVLGFAFIAPALAVVLLAMLRPFLRRAGGVLGAMAARGVLLDVERDGERFPLRREAVGESDALGFLGADRPPGEDQVHRTAVSDQAWQSNRAEVDQRDAESAVLELEGLDAVESFVREEGGTITVRSDFSWPGDASSRISPYNDGSASRWVMPRRSISEARSGSTSSSDFQKGASAMTFIRFWARSTSGRTSLSKNICSMALVAVAVLPLPLVRVSELPPPDAALLGGRPKLPT